MSSKRSSRKAFLFVVMPVVAALTAMSFGCAGGSDVAEDVVSRPATERPGSSRKNPGRVLGKVWAAPGTFDKVTHVALFGQVLYVGGMPAGVHAIDTFDGFRLWSHPCKGALSGDIVQSGDDVLLIEGREVVKLNADNGVELIRDRTRLGVRSGILPGSDSWVLAGTDDRIWGLVPDTGRGYWRVTVDDPIIDMIEDGADTLYVHTMRGTIYRISRNARDIEWELRFPKHGASPMALVGNRILVGSEDYFLYEISAEDGQILSRACLSAPVLGTPLVVEPLLYVSTGDGKLYAIDTAGLAVQWTIEGATRALTVAGDEVVFLGSRDGRSYIGVAETDTGKVVTEVSAEGFETFVADPVSGVVFAVTRNGSVLAIAHRDAEDSLPEEPVPARGHEDPEKAAVREAIRQIQAAAESGDTDRLLERLTPDSAEVLRPLIEAAGPEDVLSGFATSGLVIGKIRIEGETATVRTNVVRDPTGKMHDVPMSRIGGQWKLDLAGASEETGGE